jgi:hypothetical protein
MRSAIRGIAVSDPSPLNSLLWEMGLTINREKTDFLAAESRGAARAPVKEGWLTGGCSVLIHGASSDYGTHDGLDLRPFDIAVF